MDIEIMLRGTYDPKKKTIVICVPGKDIPMFFEKCLEETMQHLQAHFNIFRIRDYYPYLNKVRSRLLGAPPGVEKDFKPWNGEFDYDYILLLDNDMEFKPWMVKHLISHDVDMVVGAYPLADRVSLSAGRKDDNGFQRAYESISVQVGPLVPIDFSGLGFALIKKGVLEKTPCPWFDGLYFDSGKKQEVMFEEDSSFCHRVKEAGFEVFLDTTVTSCLTHWKMQPLRAKDVIKCRTDHVVVYTAQTGCRDKIHEPDWVHNFGAYICFTDQPEETIPEPWQHKPILKTTDDPARDYKPYKLGPHLFVPGYHYTVWINANVKVTNGFEDLIDRYMKDCNLLFFKHPTRDCVFEEAEAVKSFKFDDLDIIEKQIQRYRDDGMPEHFGLPECGVIISRSEPEVYRFFDFWMNEVEKGSRRDQLSVSYALWKTQPKYKILPMTQHEGQYFLITPHSNYRPTKEIINAG